LKDQKKNSKWKNKKSKRPQQAARRDFSSLSTLSKIKSSSKKVLVEAKCQMQKRWQYKTYRANVQVYKRGDKVTMEEQKDEQLFAKLP